MPRKANQTSTPGPATAPMTPADVSPSAVPTGPVAPAVPNVPVVSAEAPESGPNVDPASTGNQNRAAPPSISSTIPKQPQCNPRGTTFEGKRAWWLKMLDLADMEKIKPLMGPCFKKSNWLTGKTMLEAKARKLFHANNAKQTDILIEICDEILTHQETFSAELEELGRLDEAELSTDIYVAIGSYLTELEKRKYSIQKELKKSKPSETTVKKIPLTTGAQVHDFKAKLALALDQNIVNASHVFIYTKHVINHANKAKNAHYHVKQMKATMQEKESILSLQQQEELTLDDIFKWKGFTATKNDVTPHKEMDACKLKRETSQSSSSFTAKIGDQTNEVELEYKEMSKLLTNPTDLIAHMTLQRRVALTLSSLNSFENAVMDYSDKCKAEGITKLNLHKKQDQVLTILQGLVTKNDAAFKSKRSFTEFSEPRNKKPKYEKGKGDAKTWNADGVKCTICSKKENQAFHSDVYDKTAKKVVTCSKAPTDTKYVTARNAFTNKFSKALRPKKDNN